MGFNLSGQAWEQAEQALQGKPSGTKFDKYQKNLQGKKDKENLRVEHSFIIIEGVIYALSNRKSDMPTDGNQAIVKKGMTKNGTLVAIKIKAQNTLDSSASYQLGVQDGLNIAQALRHQPNMKIKKSDGKIIPTDYKLYTVMQWRGDDLIEKFIELDLTYTQKWLIGLKACLALTRLHRTGKLHCDFKLDNLTGTIEGNNISVNAVDFEFAKKLEIDQHFVSGDKASGSPGFVCPEILSQNRYSFLSDTYALAVVLLLQVDVTLQNLSSLYNEYLEDSCADIREGQVLAPLEWLDLFDVELPHKIYGIFKSMLHPDYEKRSDATQMILYLCNKLERDNNLEENIKKEIKQIREEHESKLIVSSIENDAQTLQTDMLPLTTNLIFKGPQPVGNQDTAKAPRQKISKVRRRSESDSSISIRSSKKPRF
ncbi:MAG: protein kinase [Candidatus Berkiella sp.]